MKSLKLENFGVQELNFQEQMAIDGGSFWSVLAGIGAAVAMIGVAVAVTAVTLGGATALVVGAAGMLLEE